MKDNELELIAHLSELRRRLMIVLGVFLLFFAIALAYVESIYQWLVSDLDVKLALLGPGDVFWIYFQISAVFSLAFTIPIAAYQAWKFVLPALKENERKATFMLIPSLFLLFILGISFGYFLVFPIVLSFMEGLASDGFQQFYTSEKYFSFLISLTVPFGLLFELPVVILFLTAIGLLNPRTLRKSRKLAYFCITVTSVLITPPDLVSDILVLVPLIFIYEVSISLSAYVYRKRLEQSKLDQDMSLQK
ncbi:twin-arginine translocase subunit TatC [Metabacillus herbersteinensis]|uniref:Sec-independent protein translocase protein TatC n=1 Tax=Metabacillus herbersteinensis TaxID=283816 RepID=A0ABV6GIQ5_9BACI